MATDIKIDQGGDGDHIVIDANVIEASAFDFVLDSPQRHTGKEGHRRALVHDQSDGLTINYNGDYPAGVSIVAANLNLRLTKQETGEEQLPHDGRVGDMRLLQNVHRIGGQIVSADFTLWLCVGPGQGGLLTGGGASSYWRQVQLGDPIMGTA
jgi:hypothetical protein